VQWVAECREWDFSQKVGKSIKSKVKNTGAYGAGVVLIKSAKVKPWQILEMV
jgi:hypothetical protein